MSKALHVGVNGVARKAKAVYVGVNGVARKVKAMWVGVNGVARQCYSAVAEAETIVMNYSKMCYDYMTSFAQSCKATSYVGKATAPSASTGHAATILRFAVPADFDKVTKLKLYVYRSGGSAGATTRVGTSADYAFDSTVYYETCYYLSSSYYTQVTLSGGNGWKEIDLTDMLSVIRSRATGGYIYLSLMSIYAYCTINGATSGNVPYLYIERSN